MDSIERVFQEIDALDTVKAVADYEQQYNYAALRKLFFDNREIALNARDAVEQRKARAKCQYICQLEGSYIPCNKEINKFVAPFGLKNIFISSYAKIGENCVIFPNTVIGSNNTPESKGEGFPVIGDHVYIGAGSAIIGAVHIGDHARIGANCVVVKDVPANAVVVSGEVRTIQKDKLDNRFIPSSEIAARLSAAAPQPAEVLSPYSTSAYIKGIKAAGAACPSTVYQTCVLLGRPIAKDVLFPSQDLDFSDLYEKGPVGFAAELRRLKVDLPVEEVEARFKSFVRKYRTQKTQVFDPTNCVVWFFDWILFAFDRGFDASDYFDFELFNKSPAKRDTFLNQGYRRSITRIANTSKRERAKFLNKGAFNRTFAEFIHRKWIDASTCDFETFKAFLEENPAVFAKPITGTGGAGSCVIRSDSDTPENLFAFCRDNKMIVEQIIKQHPDLAKFNASSTNTTRIYTLRCLDGKVRIMMACSRFGRAGRVADNFHQGGCGTLIDPATGYFTTDAISQAHLLVDKHPDSGVSFKGFRYPEWDKIVDAVTRAAKIVPGVRHVGWDITVTEDGEVEFIEGNSNSNIDLPQEPDQKGRRPEYEKHIKLLAMRKGIAFPQSETWCR